jgi:hypothetical protein
MQKKSSIFGIPNEREMAISHPFIEADLRFPLFNLMITVQTDFQNSELWVRNGSMRDGWMQRRNVDNFLARLSKKSLFRRKWVELIQI